MFLIVALVAVLFVFFDPSLFRTFRALGSQDPVLFGFFKMITYLGTSGWILVGAGLIAVVVSAVDFRSLGYAQRLRLVRYHGMAVYVLVSVAVSGSLMSLVKNSIGRARPKHLDTLGAYHFEFGAFDASFASFPSGHSTTFGAFLMALAILFPRWWLPLLVAAVLGGGSRIVVGSHYPSDVLAGLTIGALFSVVFARWLSRRSLLFIEQSTGKGAIFALPRLRKPQKKS